MMQRSLVMAALAVSMMACDRSPSQDVSGPVAVVQAAEPQPAGCADALRTDIDRDSFAAADIGADRAQLELWARDSEAAFKSAAAALCASGGLKAAELAPFKQLLIQYGGGADSAAIWVDDARPAAIILQYAFYPGSPAPSAEEAEVALSCWNDPDTTACMERLP